MPQCRQFVALLGIGFPHSLQAVRAMNSSPSMSCHTIFFDCVDMGDRKTDLSPRARGNLADSLRSVRATIAISKHLLEPIRSPVTKSNTQKKNPKKGFRLLSHSWQPVLFFRVLQERVRVTSMI